MSCKREREIFVFEPNKKQKLMDDSDIEPYDLFTEKSESIDSKKSESIDSDKSNKSDESSESDESDESSESSESSKSSKSSESSESSESQHINKEIMDELFVLATKALDDKKYKKSFKYFKLACKFCHPDSITELGKCYYEGKGVKQNYKKAYRYFQEALIINNMDEYALFRLGMMYFYGKGVDVDKVKARKYLQKAYDCDCDEALEYLF